MAKMQRVGSGKGKHFIGFEKVKGVQSALFYNYGRGERLIAIPLRQIQKAGKAAKWFKGGK